MWRAGRAASALLLRLQAGRAGARRLRATSPAEALRVPTWATSQGLRSVSGSRSSELRDAEEGAGAEEEQRQAVAEAAAATATQEQCNIPGGGGRNVLGQESPSLGTVIGLYLFAKCSSKAGVPPWRTPCPD